MILWSVQKLCWLSLLDTNITPIQNNKMQTTSSTTFNPVSRNKQTKFRFKPKQTKNDICFGFISICFVKQKTKNFVLFRSVLVFWTYIESIETNRTVSKQTKTTLNFQKNTKICSLSNCFGWFSVCFGSIETSKLSVLV